MAHRLARGLSGLVLLLTLGVTPVVVHAAPGDQPAWAVTLNATSAFSGPTDESVNFGNVPAMTVVQVLDYQGAWAHVLDPRSKAISYISSDQLGPSDPPSPYLLMPLPQPGEEFNARGVATDPIPMSIYPTWA